MATIILRSIKGSPLTIEEMDDNFTNLNIEVGQKLNSSSYTASDILTKLKTVDTDASGLNASTLKSLDVASTNTVSTIVSRDSSGNFAAGTITANLVGSVTGNADTVTDGVYTTGSYNNPSWITGLAGSKVTAIPNSSLTNSSITVNGTAVSLGGSVDTSSIANTYSAQQTFRDNLFSITDNLDNTKVLNFQLSTISSGTTRVLSVPDESGIIATRAWAQTNYESYTQTYVQTSGRNSQGNKTISTSAPTGGSVGDIWYRV